MRLSTQRLRQLIREELESLHEADQTQPSAVGKDLPATATSQAVDDKLEKNPGVIAALEKINDDKGLADVIQTIIKMSAKTDKAKKTKALTTVLSILKKSS